jgi:hypothetical protein
MRCMIYGIVFTCLFKQMCGQLEQTKNYGFNVGFVAGIGTHVQRIGVVVQAYGVYKFAQMNVAFRVYDNYKNLGPKGEHAEIGAAVGLCLGYGKHTNDTNLFVSSIGNQTGYKNSVAYSYNLWFNNIKTSQVTGIIALQFNRVSVIAENDLLAKPYYDRFRTGAFLIQYQTRNFQYAVNCTMWTGQMGKTMRNDSLYPYKGYQNLDGSVYGNLSHGLLSGQVKYANQYGQYLQANAGVDAEQVRNVMQNKLIHDMVFIPAKWNKANNVHLPMIDREAKQYLYKDGQKIRKPALFINAYLSPNVFY